MKPCTQCGRCCTNPDFMERLGISDEDMDRWRREGRQDILAKVSKERGWRDAKPCAFLLDVGNGVHTCSIYQTRPETCREYPIATVHMRFVDCEMLEPGDTDADVARFMGRKT